MLGFKGHSMSIGEKTKNESRLEGKSPDLHAGLSLFLLDMGPGIDNCNKGPGQSPPYTAGNESEAKKDYQNGKAKGTEGK
jgi:hypothetical protein